jgi:hypothetical protein
LAGLVVLTLGVLLLTPSSWIARATRRCR